MNLINSQIESTLQSALSFYQKGKLSEATTLLQRIIKLSPHDFNALHLLGVIHKEIGDHKKSLIYFNKALELDNKYSKIHYNIGLLYYDMAQYVEAIIHFNNAIRLEVDFQDAILSKGNALCKLRQFIPAIAAYDQLIYLNSLDFEGWNYKGFALSEINCYEEALKAYDKAISLKPDYHEAWNNKGVAFKELQKYEEALKAYDKAISLKPDYHEAWNNKGVAFKELQKYEEALKAYDKAISLKPDYHEAWNNKGVAFKELQKYEEALKAYDKAISLKPDYFQSVFNKSLTQLLLGNFQEGWQNYEYRWHATHGNKTSHQEIPRLKRLNNIRGKKIIVWSEQGYGDSIQFCRYILKLIELGADVIFETQEPLQRLLKNSIDVTIIGQGEPFESADFQIPLLSLPLIFETNINNISPSTPYLKASNTSLKKWKSRINFPKNGKLNIGIACSGNEKNLFYKNRSIDLACFSALLPQSNLFLIQKDLKEKDVVFLENHPEIQFFGPDINCFEDSASIIQMMDLVISIDTALAHLSGAMGKPVFILIPWSPEWRWLLDRNDSPWYESAKLFRQDALGEWGGVISKVLDRLKLYKPKPTDLKLTQ